MTLCEHCGKPLANFTEVHAVKGLLFCSRECAIDAITNDTIMNAKEAAIEEYASCAEVVATAEILKDEMRVLVEDNNSTCGVKREVYVTYIPSEDKTIVWQDLVQNDNQIIQTAIVGWYFGEPDEKTTERFSHNTNIAHFI